MYQPRATTTSIASSNKKNEEAKKKKKTSKPSSGFAAAAAVFEKTAQRLSPFSKKKPTVNVAATSKQQAAPLWLTKNKVSAEHDKKSSSKTSTSSKTSSSSLLSSKKPRASTPEETKKPTSKKASTKPSSSSSRRSSKQELISSLTSTSNDKEDSSLLKAALSKLKDKSKQSLVESLVHRIERAKQHQTRRRLSLRDCDTVLQMERVIRNDPTMSDFCMDEASVSSSLSRTQVLDFCEGLGTNLCLKRLTITGAIDHIDNGFLSALAVSIESNIVLEQVVLNGNQFTSDALVDFCQALSVNTTIKHVDLRNQMSQILQPDLVEEALKANRSLESFCMDACKSSPSLQATIDSVLKRNKQKPQAIDLDSRLIDLLEKEAVRAEELQAQLENKELSEDSDDSNLDWNYLLELSNSANKYNLATTTAEGNNSTESDSSATKSLSLPRVQEPSSQSFKMRQDRAHSLMSSSGRGGGVVNFTSDGAFLTSDFISSYLVEDGSNESLTFAFQAQSKLFKRFPVGDADRRFIATKFADVLVDHPQASKITHINMANSACGDEWLVRLCARCLENPKLLPRLHLLNVETNFISTAGVMALAKCIASDKTMRYLQAVKLENQRHLISSRAELELAKALCVNRSVIRFSLRVRNLWERNQINKFVSRNLDLLRQARLKHAIRTGSKTERARNAMEALFDRVAANDPELSEVEVVGNQLFLAFPRVEVIKAAASFATNGHARVVRMTMLNLDDKFAETLAKSIEKNSTIEKLILDSNTITGDGILALVKAMSTNTSIVELQLRHQGKPMSSAHEEQLVEALGDNTTLVKFGVDLRSLLAQTQLERKLKSNFDLRRKNRQEERELSKTASSSQKPVGKMQEFFCKIAANDPSVPKNVELVGDKLFLAMREKDKLQAASSFATNSSVKCVKLVMLQLDDRFACELAKSLSANSSIEKVYLDSNMIGSEGILALVSCLAENKTIIELQVRHQKKALASSDEEELCSKLGDNTSIVKLGIDLRSPLAQRGLEVKLSRNRDLQRKARARAKSATT